MSKKKQMVLFICTHNSCRSQMAEGLLNHLCSNKYQAFSAGVVKSTVHQLAIKVMEEIGIDISSHYSKSVDEFREIKFDTVVTVCDNAKETCPFYPGKQVIHKGFTDPASVQGSFQEQIQAFRCVRDEIKEWILKEFCGQRLSSKKNNGDNHD